VLFSNTAGKSGFITSPFGNYVYGGVDYSSANKWNHIVLSQSGSTVFFYINGSLYASLSGIYIANNVNQKLVIGASLLDNEYMLGNIPLVKFYKGKALSAQEVLQNYNATKGRFGLT
jgi:hypothetical protein